MNFTRNKRVLNSQGIFILVSIFFSFSSHAQAQELVISPMVLGSSGNPSSSVDNADIRVDWTLGELVATTLSSEIEGTEDRIIT